MEVLALVLTTFIFKSLLYRRLQVILSVLIEDLHLCGDLQLDWKLAWTALGRIGFGHLSKYLVFDLRCFAQHPRYVGGHLMAEV